MKIPSLCCMLLVITLAILAFFEIRDTVNGDRMNFLARMYYSSPQYAKMIEIKAYLLNNEQLDQLLTHPNMEIQQPKKGKFSDIDQNVVLRIKNHGNATAWGTLAYSVNSDFWWKIDVVLPSNDSTNGKAYYEYVIPTAISISYSDNELPEPILVKWISLYTKN